MSEEKIEGAATHTVLINDEGQYSLWLIRKPVRAGVLAQDNKQ